MSSMNISYRYANPDKTSILLKFDGLLPNQTSCILVDSGGGVDVDRLLGDDEYLSGILLTHLHSDHYMTLSENLRDGASVYTSELNSKLIDTVFSTANSHSDGLIDIRKVSDNVVPVKDSVSPVGDLTIKTAPAGHTPGATSFYIEFEDSGTTQTILVTGDFTQRRVAGYPGLSPRTVDCVVLTGATNDSFEDNISDAVNDIIRDSLDSWATLVTASGTNSIHIAYLLGHAISQNDLSLDVSIVGQAAKIYNTLGYNVPSVSAYENYDSYEVVSQCDIVISGPETPITGGSKTLLDEIRHDDNASLFQLVSEFAKDIGNCVCDSTVYEISNHPSEQSVDQFVRRVDPKHVIVTHQTSSSLESYRDKYSSLVWANTDDSEYTFYNNGWIAPSWVDSELANTFLNKRSGDTLGLLDFGDVQIGGESFGLLEPDLEAEGVDLDTFVVGGASSNSSSTSSGSTGGGVASNGSDSMMQSASLSEKTESRSSSTDSGRESGSSGSDNGQQVIRDIGAKIAYIDNGTIVLSTDDDLDEFDVGDDVTVVR